MQCAIAVSCTSMHYVSDACLLHSITCASSATTFAAATGSTATACTDSNDYNCSLNRAFTDISCVVTTASTIIACLYSDYHSYSVS